MVMTFNPHVKASSKENNDHCSSNITKSYFKSAETSRRRNLTPKSYTCHFQGTGLLYCGLNGSFIFMLFTYMLTSLFSQNIYLYHVFISVLFYLCLLSMNNTTHRASELIALLASSLSFHFKVNFSSTQSYQTESTRKHARV